MLLSWIQKHRSDLSRYFGVAVLTWLTKNDEAACLAAFNAATTAVGIERQLMVTILLEMASDGSTPDRTKQALFLLVNMICAKEEWSFFDLLRNRRELGRLDKDYAKAMFPPDPEVFYHRYPGLPR